MSCPLDLTLVLTETMLVEIITMVTEIRRRAEPTEQKRTLLDTTCMSVLMEPCVELPPHPRDLCSTTGPPPPPPGLMFHSRRAEMFGLFESQEP